MIGGQERPGVFRGNDMFVPVRKGEVLEIWIENHSGKLTLMRLLVDGLNTLPELEKAKGVATYLVASGSTWTRPAPGISTPKPAKSTPCGGSSRRPGRKANSTSSSSLTPTPRSPRGSSSPIRSD